MRTLIGAGLICCTGAIISGCGCDGYNEPRCDGSAAKTTTTKTVAVGTLTSSNRTDPAKFATTITTKGQFSTYTSLIIPTGTTVEMQEETDTTTKLVIKQTLFGGNKSTLVKAVLELLP